MVYFNYVNVSTLPVILKGNKTHSKTNRTWRSISSSLNVY